MARASVLHSGRGQTGLQLLYVVIGAAAFPIHGYARATVDIDIFIEPSRDNAERTRAALVAFGYDMSKDGQADGGNEP